MKKTNLVFFMLILTYNFYGQPLPSKISDYPDGFSIYYYDGTINGDNNGTKDTCFSEIFIGDTLIFMFVCANHSIYKRTDISSDSIDIKRLKELITFDYLDKLLYCMEIKNQGDTNHGHYFFLKKGNKDRFVALDINYEGAKLCGSKQLNEIIDRKSVV